MPGMTLLRGSKTMKQVSSSLDKTDLTNGPVVQKLIGFSLPFVAGTLLQTLYSTVDMVVVGQFLGQDGLSAVSNGSQLMQMLYLVCIGFSSAGQILIAQAHGAREQKKIQAIVDTLLRIEIAFALVIGGACVFLSRALLTALDVPPEAFAQARYYIVICSVGMLFTGLYNMFSAVFRGCGDSVHPLLFVFIASVTNLVLDVLFVALFRWNVAGAALATVIGQLVSVLFCVGFIRREPDTFSFCLRIRQSSADRETALQLMKIGIPMAIQSSAVHFSFLFVSRMVNSLGVAVSAAFGVSQKLRSLPSVLTQGLSLGCTAMMGQNLGAGKLDRVQKTMYVSLLFNTLINLAFALVFYAMPVLCFRGFTQDPTVLQYARICIFALLVEIPGRCLIVCGSLVNAQGFVQFSTLIGFLDAFAGRVFFCWFLGIVMHMGALGFFVGYSAGTYLTAVPTFLYFVSGLWKRRAVLVKSTD